MNSLRALSYVKEDPGWVRKVLVGGALMSFPILTFVTNGYQIQVMRNLLNGSRQPLPEWRDIGGLFGEGLKVAIAIYLLYTPMLVLGFFDLIFGILPLFVYFTDDSRTAGGIKLAAGIGVPLVVILTTIYAAVLAVLHVSVPAMVIRYVKTGSFLACLNVFGATSFVAQHLGQYLATWLAWLSVVTIAGALSATVSAAGFWLLGLGVLLGWLILHTGRFWTRLMWAYALVDMEAGGRIEASRPSVTGAA